MYTQFMITIYKHIRDVLKPYTIQLRAISR